MNGFHLTGAGVSISLSCHKRRDPTTMEVR
jgi:hypothetical protein